MSVSLSRNPVRNLVYVTCMLLAFTGMDEHSCNMNVIDMLVHVRTTCILQYE